MQNYHPPTAPSVLSGSDGGRAGGWIWMGQRGWGGGSGILGSWRAPNVTEGRGRSQATVCWDRISRCLRS